MAILSGLAFQPIGYGLPDGTRAKAINTGPLDWTQANTYLLDSTQTLQLRALGPLQSIFFDNTNTTGITTVTVSGTGQIIRVAPGAQAALPILGFDNPVVTIQNTSGNGSTQIWPLTVPAFGGQWSVAAPKLNLLVNAATINVSPWFSSGTGVSRTSATTLQTGATNSSLGQNFTVVPLANYTASLSISATAGGNAWCGIYSTDYGASYGGQLVSLTGTPQAISYPVAIPDFVTGAVFEIDLDTTASGIVTVTNASVTLQ